MTRAKLLDPVPGRLARNRRRLRRARHLANPVNIAADHVPRLQQVRDSGAYGQYLAALVAVDPANLVDYGPICNRAGLDPPPLDADDLVVYCCRRPDRDPEATRRIVPSGSDLEAALFAAIDPYFEELTRGCLTLSPLAASWLPARYRDRSSMSFRVYTAAHCVDWREPDGPEPVEPPPDPAAVGVLIINPPGWDVNGSELVVGFSLSGDLGYAWSMLATRHCRESFRRRTPRFVLAEFEAPDLRNAASFDAVLGCECRLLIDQPLGVAAAVSR